MEFLQQQLAYTLQHEPLAEPLTAETVIVPSIPVQRWLGLQLATSLGINCNIDYALPASWMWHWLSASSDTPHRPDPLSRDSTAWLLFGILPDIVQQPSCAPLLRYLNHDDEGIKRWQLCCRIADLFDRYQYYRPEMIRRWSKGDGDGWQPLLWRALLQKVGHHHHRVALVDHWLDQHGKKTPARVSLFCINSLPPLLMSLLQGIAQHCSLYLYYLTPTNNYWADLKTGKALAKQQLKQPEEIQDDDGHALLASWGRQGQAFQEMLLDHASLHTMETDLFDERWPTTLLGQLQREIFYLQHEEAPCQADGSLEIHLCHSEQRECQVLYDALLQRFQRDATLKPEDVLVMVPDINRYAPYLTALFANQGNHSATIPWHISDITAADEQPVVRAFLQLIQLPGSRFVLSEILALLDVPEICRHFSLDLEQVSRIRSVLQTWHVRWGIDADHRRTMGLPRSIENSWQQAEQRFLVGYAMGDEAGLWQGVAPSPLDRNDSEIMARFWQLFDQLNRWRVRLQSPRTAETWQTDLNEMVDTLFSPDDDASHLPRVREAIAQLGLQANHHHLSNSLVHDWLRHYLEAMELSSPPFSGGVRICGMRPMRSLPCRITCLLGMQDSAFPRRERPIAFDLMAAQWQLGDPNRGEMDRYLMLETLLCTRDTLHISYIARNISDNSICQPSVLVAELCDLLQQRYGKQIIEAITHAHPMQPFAAENFIHGNSYDRYWCSLANAIDHHREAKLADNTSYWPQQAIESNSSASDNPIVLSHLLSFVKHPVKYFVNHSLGLFLDEKDAICNDEPFALDGLQQWQLRERLLQAMLHYQPQIEKRLKAEGALPHGKIADKLLADASSRMAQLQASAEMVIKTDNSQQIIDLSFKTESGWLHIHGQIEHYYRGQGAIHLSPSKLSGKYLLALWVEHLALCANGIMQNHEVSRWVGIDRSITLPPLSCTQAQHLLADVASDYLHGIQQPLPIFPATSWVYAERFHRDRKADHALSCAEKVWQVWPDSGEIHDPYISLIMRGMDSPALENTGFEAWAERWYLPLLEVATLTKHQPK